MSLDSGNRSFLVLLGISLLALYLTLGAGACILLSILGYELATGGIDALADRGTAVWPALTFLALVGAGALAGAHSLARQLGASRELSQRMREMTAPASPALADASSRAGVAGRLRMIESPDRFSFAYGVLTPRIAISRGLVDTASPDELDAVLAHEGYHVQNLDPLKVVVARTLSAALFYVPVLRHLRARYITGRELAADRRAVETCGRRPLAGALFKVVESPPWPELSTAAAIGGPEQLDMRIAQLEAGTEPAQGRLPGLPVALSAAGLATVATVFGLAVAGFGGLDAVVQETMPGARLGALEVVLAIACLPPWLGGGWLLYRWLRRRARLSADA